jgi:hypothetical protein
LPLGTWLQALPTTLTLKWLGVAMFDPWKVPDELLDDPGYWRRRAAIAVREASRTQDLRGWLILQAQAQEFEDLERAARAAERRAGLIAIAGHPRRRTSRRSASLPRAPGV